MDTSLDDLFALFGPPEFAPPLVDWTLLEAEIGFLPPVDYRLIVNRYPALRINEFLGVLHPGYRDAGGNVDLVHTAEWILDDARSLREEFPEGFPHPLHPEPSGIFPWALTDNGDHLFWKIVGPSGGWQIVVAGRDYTEDDWWSFSGSTSDFLVGLLRQEVRCPLFPDSFPGGEVHLEQYRVT